MEITIESTTKLVELGPIPARIWEGKTESGIPMLCYVTRVAVRNNADQSQFDRELQEHRAPSAEVAAIPPRLIL